MKCLGPFGTEIKRVVSTLRAVVEMGVVGLTYGRFLPRTSVLVLAVETIAILTNLAPVPTIDLLLALTLMFGMNLHIPKAYTATRTIHELDLSLFPTILHRHSTLQPPALHDFSFAATARTASRCTSIYASVGSFRIS